MKPLVVLRPEPGASRSAARAQDLGLRVIKIPLFAVVPVEWRAPNAHDFDALVLTSANAIRHGGEELLKLRSLPVHAVGEATAALARTAGFTVISVGQRGSASMNLPPDHKLLHLAGRDHLPIPAATTMAVYEAREIDQPDGVAQIDECTVAVHSPRSGFRLAELVHDRSRIAVSAISAAAADACGQGWLAVGTASEPNDMSLLALAGRLCEGHDA